MATAPDRLREAWARWCLEAASANGLTYEEVCRRLEAGEAAMRITVTLPARSVTVPLPGAVVDKVK